ncbi:MAG: T9SS type A sorting domain-containing protein, partial [Chitinophagaceae bacterium]|nr:T9SS type A sorting domain-containing protein [Chitinophagaceae bacterium]
MKKFLLSGLFALAVLITNAQCDIASGSTTQVSTTVNGDSTTYVFNLTFNLATNNGNKYFNIDFYLANQYPATLSDGAPKPTCPELATSKINISVDNNVNAPNQPAVLSTYDGASCTPTITPQHTGLVVTKIYNPGGSVPAGYDQYTIQNITLTLHSTTSPTLKFFIWSSQASSQSVAHCSFGPVTLSPTGGPLPVVISSFNASRNNNNVSIQWQTSSEFNAKNFEIQRAYDNSTYQTVGTVASHGTSNTLQSYSYTDNSNNSKGVSYYRIKSVDINGRVVYTTIKSVKGNGARSGFVVFPNPSFGNAKISITDLNEPTTVQLFDNNGKMVKNITLTNSNIVEITNLSTG